MIRVLRTAISVLAVCVVACSPKAPVQPQVAKMATSADSMSYVVGLNIGLNLIKADSMLNIEFVKQGIEDVYRGEHKLRDEEARTAFLKYMNYDNYERVKRYEKQFLEDLRKQDRKFVATSSGLTYKISELGDLKSAIRSTRDTAVMSMRVLNVAGEVVDTTFWHGDTLRMAVRDMPRGVQEAARLIGQDGHIEAWLPSQLAFGSEGCDSLDVKPNTMLYYELTLIDVVNPYNRR